MIVMLTALTGVLAGLDHPTQRPFGIAHDAMHTEQTRLTRALGLRAADTHNICRKIPTGRA